MRSLALIVAAFLAASMVLTCVPISANGELPVEENWPVFRPGTASTFVEPSMVVDSNGSVHLAYAYDPTPGDDYMENALHRYSVLLRYAVLTNNSWEYQDLGEEEWIQRVSVGVSENGEPHLLCMQIVSNFTVDLVHWQEVNGSWSSEIIRTFSNLGITAFDVAIDQENNVHLVMSATLDEDLSYKTHLYMNNIGGNWTSYELATVRSSGAVWNNPPQIAFDNEGRPHVAYLNVTDYVFEDWFSGNHSIEIMTFEGGEWQSKHSLNVGTLNRFSFGLDDEGYEYVMYHQDRFVGDYDVHAIRLAWWTQSGWWSYKSYDEYGSQQCQLIMDDGVPHMVFVKEGYDLRLLSREGVVYNWAEEHLRIPNGMRTYGQDFVAGPWDHLGLLYFDQLTGSIAVSQPGTYADDIPPALHLEQDQLEVRVSWEPVNVSVTDRCVVYRSDGASFVINESFVDSTLDENSWDQTYQYRLSIITPEGEEYVGPLAEIWMEPKSDPWALFDVLIAVLVVIAVIIALVWYVNRQKLNR
ncbi:MAG: hypothetical protein AB9860_03645 [Methanomassiliicoccales archaeon]